jgi:Fe-S-cluster-containing dehydrogenase component/anaerobic selenocysteine-containing dehydrogenase
MSHDHHHDDVATAPPALDFTRRGFLAATGFTLAGALSGCGRAPVQRTVAPATQPEHAAPGTALWYASTCAGCSAGCGVLVKCRDGRPIKLEGNPEHPLSAGGLCAVGQASLLGLYDSRRLLRPKVGGREVAWEAADERVRAGLAQAAASGTSVRLLTGTVTSVSTRRWIATFLAAHPGSRHVAYDALSCSALLDAHARTHGARVLPRYRLERCTELLVVEADPLGTWISPVEHTRARAQARAVGGAAKPCHHEQVESVLTLTGSNADRRRRIAPGDVPAFVAHLAARLAAKAGLAAPAPAGPAPLGEPALAELVERLWSARGRALVLCGSAQVDVQVLVNLANHALGAYGATIDLAAPSQQKAGDDAALVALLGEIEAGRVGALLVAGVNPLADAVGWGRAAAALGKVAFKVALAEREDETTALCDAALPLPHALEAWDDAEPVAGLVSLAQPALAPLGRGRTLRQCLAAWLGKPTDDLALVREAFPAGAAWTQAVHDGFATRAVPAAAARDFDPASVPAAAPRATPPAAGRLALVAAPSVAMLDGRHAHNPWLQELPDPITKQVWGNAALLAPATAARLGLADGDVVRLTGEGASVELPALLQRGLAEDTVAVATGYGRAGTDRFAEVGPQWFESEPTVARGGTVGANVTPLLAPRGAAASVSLTKTGATSPLARSQTYDTLDLPAHLAPKGHERRDAVREIRPEAAAHAARGHGGGHGAPAVLWGQEDPAQTTRWGMVIDLSACTGCSACVVACQAENNVPVVGKDEVLRRRDLAWMRIDRYYADAPGSPGDVDVAHQPMLCQHCANAPCETVCPVLATTHSKDGLNEQAYNRCVGTRYCANNCPYKVRRFNWFDYDRADPWQDLQLNPDVTVRSRGVMEKCSFCVQRITEARARARVAGARLADGDVRTACQQSCPAGAIVFGDLKDKASAVARAAGDGRRYDVLEELHVRPSVGYLAKVRDAGAKGGQHE